MTTTEEEFDSWHSNDCEDERHNECCYANTGCTCRCHFSGNGEGKT